MFARIIGASRSLTTTAIRAGHDMGGVPGTTLPFQIKNKYRLTAVFTIFFGSAFAVPFILIRHQLIKNRGD